MRARIDPSTTSGTSAKQGRKLQKIVLPGQTPEGEYIMGVLVKRSYLIVAGRKCVRAELDQKLIPGDLHYGDPMNSTVKFETDHIPFKVATDVVLNGKAYAPGGVPTDALTASVIVGQLRKEIRVIGDRVCRYQSGRDPVFTEAAPFKGMEVRYERAYGGIDIYSNPKVPCAYARNPLGRGFVVGTSKRAIENLSLPNIEDPKDLLTPARLPADECLHWERQPVPQGFGWVSMYWQPRASLAGVMPADRQAEQELRKIYEAVVPPDQRAVYEQTKLPAMDFRFFNGASPGLVLPFLVGDETIRLINLAPEGELTFHLPGERPKLGLDIGMGIQEEPVLLHTVMIRMEERQVDLVWRSAVPYPGPDWLPQMRKMEVFVQ